MKPTSYKLEKIIVFSVTALFLVFCLFYTRPMSLLQMYPLFTPDICTGIEVRYSVEGGEWEELSIEKNSADFEKLCDLLYEKTYRRKLINLLPQRTYSSHRIMPGDYTWEILFYFEKVEFPSGDLHSGPLLEVRSWYGNLTVTSGLTSDACRTRDQENWSDQVLDVILNH